MPRVAYVGLMSGTSADGVDACLASFAGGRPRLLGHVAQPYGPQLRAGVIAAMAGTDIAHASELDVQLADAYARAVEALLAATGTARAAVRAIGCHGQTVLHRPRGPCPTSIQLGDPGRLAVRTGIDVVADFRRADMAAGGEGAPLAPAFHAAAFHSEREARAVVNIGGIGNVTLIAPAAGEVAGFDTGLGNALLDAWVERHHGVPFDRDGAWAARGRVDRALLEALLADPYFDRAPPKSTGREHFHLAWVERGLERRGGEVSAGDVQATLAELTAVTIARALERHAPDAPRVYVCGGGARNADLMARLAARLPDRRVDSTEALGIAPEQVEPMAFAWLAQRRVRGLPGNRPEVTGAARPLVLGSLTEAPPAPYPDV